MEQEERHNYARLLRLLIEHAYEYRTEPFTLKSGQQSHHYVDARQVTLTHEGAHCVGEEFLRWVKTRDIQAIGGPSIGADPSWRRRSYWPIGTSSLSRGSWSARR